LSFSLFNQPLPPPFPPLIFPDTLAYTTICTIAAALFFGQFIYILYIVWVVKEPLSEIRRRRNGAVPPPSYEAVYFGEAPPTYSSACLAAAGSECAIVCVHSTAHNLSEETEEAEVAEKT
jgi:hypothetical protein